jgi:hypothetical protein
MRRGVGNERRQTNETTKCHDGMYHIFNLSTTGHNQQKLLRPMLRSRVTTAPPIGILDRQQSTLPHSNSAKVSDGMTMSVSNLRLDACQMNGWCKVLGVPGT